MDKERKEAKRLSAQVTEQKQSHGVLQQRLKETEEARVTAEKELLEASKVREDLEARRQMMIQELSTAMVSGMEDDRPSSAASAPIDGHGRRNAGRRRSSSLGSIGSGLEGFSDDGLTHEERDAMERRHVRS